MKDHEGFQLLQRDVDLQKLREERHKLRAEGWRTGGAGAFCPRLRCFSARRNFAPRGPCGQAEMLKCFMYSWKTQAAVQWKKWGWLGCKTVEAYGITSGWDIPDLGCRSLLYSTLWNSSHKVFVQIFLRPACLATLPVEETVASHHHKDLILVIYCLEFRCPLSRSRVFDTQDSVHSGINPRPSK